VLLPLQDERGTALESVRSWTSLTEGSIELELEAGEHWIAIASRPFRPTRHGEDDARPLGLPVRSLSFEPS
jgi:hypothetical protein